MMDLTDSILGVDVTTDGRLRISALDGETGAIIHSWPLEPLATEQLYQTLLQAKRAGILRES